MKKNNIVKKIADSRALWMVLSFLIALFMWTYVSSQETTEYKKTFSDVPVTFVGEEALRSSRNMIVAEKYTESVTVEIVGPRRIVSALNSSDLYAKVDVSAITQAANTSRNYTIVYPDGTDTSSLKTTSRTPETVNFLVSTLSKKQIPVRGSFEGSLADGYTAEAPVYDPAVITVFGPDVYLNQVKYAWLTFGAGEEVDQTYSVESAYTLRDDNDEDCSAESLSFSKDTVTVTLPIIPVKEVPLQVKIEYGAGATEANTIITIEPATILLAGDKDELDQLDSIVLATIDAREFTTSFTDTYEIRFDEGLKNLSGVSEAKVTVELVNLVTDKFIVRNITYKNLTEGYKAEIITDAITITLRGTVEQIKAIKAENIRAEVDLEDYVNSTGSYIITPRIRVDGFKDVDVFGEVPSISIVLSKGNS